MKGQKALFAHGSDEWETPADVFSDLDDEFHFYRDAAATPGNALCPVYFTKEDSALGDTPWDEGHRPKNATDRTPYIFMNPPYSLIDSFMARALSEVREHFITVVALIPNRSDNYWYHHYVRHAAEIRVIEGRLSFGHQPPENDPNKVFTTATFPSIIAVFRPWASLAPAPVLKFIPRPGKPARRSAYK